MFGVSYDFEAKDDGKSDEDGMNMREFGLFFASSLILKEKWKHLPGITITTCYGQGTSIVLTKRNSRPDTP